jgi:hypothetical protein
VAKHADWPPYRLLEDSLVDTTERRMERLERLYHKGQELAWDGRTVLADLIQLHGRPRLPPDRREPALKILSILLWGELAAWAISADLAERIDDVEAKMAATSQAHDEARHFYVLRDYLRAVGEPVPRLGGLGRRLLLGILETESIVHKLVGMQLLVESNALAIFRGLADARLEPVLGDLLPYYEKDEARHVGLGTLYLPRLLGGLSRFEAAGVVAFQLRCVGLLMSGGMTLRRDFEALGFDARKVASHTMELQDRIVREMVQTEKGGARGLLNPKRGFGPAILDLVHPPEGMAALPAWKRRFLEAWTRAAKLADRALA